MARGQGAGADESGPGGERGVALVGRSAPTVSGMNRPGASSTRALAIASLPVAAAIGVFGVVYGAAARPVLGVSVTLLSSLLVFSGAAQFTVIALLSAGAGTAAVLGAVAILGVRHLPLGAVLQPPLAGTDRRRRAVLSLALIDETTGLALTRPEPVHQTLAVTGGLAYTAWVLGTAAGLAGATLASLEPVAEALFPVLFIGLAALTSSKREDVTRAVLAGGGSIVVLVAVPGLGAIGAIAVAVVVAVVVSER